MNAGRTNVQCIKSRIRCGKISRYSKNLFVYPRGHRSAPCISNFKFQISNLKYEISNTKSQIRNRTIAARWARGITNTLPAKMECHPNVPAIFTTPRPQSRVNETPAVPRSCSARKPFLLQLSAGQSGHLEMLGNSYQGSPVQMQQNISETLLRETSAGREWGRNRTSAVQVQLRECQTRRPFAAQEDQGTASVQGSMFATVGSRETGSFLRSEIEVFQHL